MTWLIAAAGWTVFWVVVGWMLAKAAGDTDDHDGRPRG